MSVIDMFFKLGDKATRGDPQRQADFIYYMVWIIFIAFLTMFVTNLYRFFLGQGIDHLIWAGIGFAVTSIQYFSLKDLYQNRKVLQRTPIESVETVESVDEMMDLFSKKDSKGGKK